MNEPQQEEGQELVTPIERRRLIQVLLVGAAVGLLVWGLTFVLETYVFKAIMCQGNQTMKCVEGARYAEITATVIAAAVGLFGLVKLQIFRPLVVVLASTIGLWGLVDMLVSFAWYGVALGCIVLYALAYLAFTWLVRLRVLWLVVVVLLVVVTAMRFVLTV